MEFAATRLRRPYLFSRKRKDMEEKSAWGRGVHPALPLNQNQICQMLRSLQLTQENHYFAPPVVSESDFLAVAV